jgi:hypothetical protein
MVNTPKPTIADLLAVGKAEQHRARMMIASRGKDTGGIDINALAAKLAQELLWRPTRLVTIFTHQECLACGSENTALSHIMVEQEHLRERGARRLLRCIDKHPELPRTSEIWKEYITTCYLCYNDEAPLPRITPLDIPPRVEISETPL